MNNMISWEQLILFLVVFLFFYYAVILFFFYRKDILQLAKAGNKKPYSHSIFTKNDDTVHSVASSTDADLYNSVHELLEDLKTVFQAAVSDRLEKSQVLEALVTRIKKYPSLKGTAFQLGINNHIEQELNAACGMVLLEHEADSLWR